MAGIPRKYTDKQRAAILRAYFEDGLSPRKAARKAREEGLYGLPRWAQNDGTARAAVYAEKRNRRGAQVSKLAQRSAGEAHEELRKRLLAMTDFQLLRTEGRIKARKLNDREAFSAISACAAAIRAVQGLAEPAQAPSKHSAPAPMPESAADLARREQDRLMRQLDKASKRSDAKRRQAEVETAKRDLTTSKGSSASAVTGLADDTTADGSGGLAGQSIGIRAGHPPNPDGY